MHLLTRPTTPSLSAASTPCRPSCAALCNIDFKVAAPGDCYCPELPKPQPVCGVNNVTYNSTCQAWCADVKVQSQGPCDAATAVPSNGPRLLPGKKPLPSGPKPDAGNPAAGNASPAPSSPAPSSPAPSNSSKPEVCAQVWLPVCGEDGVTYPNTCELMRAGVGHASDGEC
jgi:hypothetical protein